MADVRPTKLQNDGNVYGSLREFADGDTVPIAQGGTGAATAAGARTSLGLGSAAVRSALGSTGALYSRDSILGAVSQSSGVPTGAVIDRGSNANGEYVRFADGTQICWTNTLTFTAVVSSVGANWSYPASFSSSYPIAGAVSASGAGGDYDSGVSARNQERPTSIHPRVRLGWGSSAYRRHHSRQALRLGITGSSPSGGGSDDHQVVTVRTTARQRRAPVAEQGWRCTHRERPGVRLHLLPEGGELPTEAIGSELFAGPVARRNGRLELTLRFPLAADASAAARFPEPLLIEADGPVELPR